jgi:hypothetical protein
VAGEDVKKQTQPADARDDDGVDLTLIRWMLSLTPSERLDALQGFADSLYELRHATRSE